MNDSNINQMIPRLIPTKEVLKILGIGSYNTLQKKITENGFPRPIRDGRRLYWVHNEVIDYLNKFIAEKPRE